MERDSQKTTCINRPKNGLYQHARRFLSINRMLSIAAQVISNGYVLYVGGAALMGTK